jgi:hypothetical protein
MQAHILGADFVISHACLSLMLGTEGRGFDLFLSFKRGFPSAFVWRGRDLMCLPAA